MGEQRHEEVISRAALTLCTKTLGQAIYFCFLFSSWQPQDEVEYHCGPHFTEKLRLKGVVVVGLKSQNCKWL